MNEKRQHGKNAINAAMLPPLTTTILHTTTTTVVLLDVLRVLVVANWRCSTRGLGYTSC